MLCSFSLYLKLRQHEFIISIHKSSTMSHQQHIFSTKQAVAKQFAEDLLQWTNTTEKFTIALSGGSTPKVLFKLLAKEYLDRMNWQHIHFYWGDERCVPPNHADSNFKMTYDLLLKHIPIHQLNVHRIRGEKEPLEEAKRYGKLVEYSLRHVNGLPQFDLVMLGMGDDGHTASIFPHQIEFLKSEEVCELARHPESGQFRVTLTGKIINNAKRIAFLVTGAGKAQKVDEVINHKDNWMYLPAAHIQAQHGDTIWYLDEAAASAVKD